MNTLLSHLQSLTTDEQLAYGLLLLDVVREDDYGGTPMAVGVDNALDVCWRLLRRMVPDPKQTYFRDLRYSNYYRLADRHGRGPEYATPSLLLATYFEAIAAERVPEEALLPYFHAGPAPLEELLDYVINVKGRSVAALDAVITNGLDLANCTRTTGVDAFAAEGLL